MHVEPALAAYIVAERLQRQLHPDDVMLSMHLLLAIAGCDLRMGKPKEAESVARKILSGAPYTQERIGLAAIATAHSRLGDALRGQGRYKDAIPVMQQSLHEYEQSQGPDSQGAISSLSALSYLYSLDGDDAKALQLQREVWQRAVQRWGAQSQYALVELLNLGSDEYDTGDLKSSLPHFQQAAAGLAKVSGEHSPVTQAARVALANALSDAGRDKDALAMIREIDPKAYQATTSDPGRALVLRAMQARIEFRLHQSDGEANLRDAIAAMQTAGLDKDEIATFQQELPQPSGR
jgi:non-specific serine/threonine protein kinase